MKDPMERVNEALAQFREQVSEALTVLSWPYFNGITLGALIRQRRKELGLSLEEVATLCGTTKSHVWSLEQGRSRNPSVAMVHGLSLALMVPFMTMASAALAATPEGDFWRANAPGKPGDKARDLSNPIPNQAKES